MGIKYQIKLSNFNLFINKYMVHNVDSILLDGQIDSFIEVEALL